MRKQNSEFLTAFTSEASNDIKNTDYFGFVELDDYACYVIADGIDDQLEALSARLAVTAATNAFLEAPSMGRRTVKKCLRAANKALLEAKSKTRLKASVLIVLTDYVKLRYGQAGNIRLRLYRNGFLQHATADQSLTMDLVREEKVPQDKVAAHIERNNLYTYLGQEKDFHPHVSKKIKLTNSDAVALYTRGVWEHVDEGELKDLFADATDQPEETVDSMEDLLLSRQPGDLQKYTFVVIFANKLFVDPNRKRKIRRVIMVIVPIVAVIAVVGVLLVVRHNSREDKKARLQLAYTDTIEYIQLNNYVRAGESCDNASALAEELKDRSMQAELGSCKKLIEAVQAAQGFLDAEDYAEAQGAFLEAAKQAAYVDNLGLDYIKDKLELTAGYISVYDLIYLGDSLMQNLQYDRAEEKYLEAKAQALKLYFDKGRSAAMEALEKLYEEQKAQAEAEEEARQEQLAAEESGVNFIAQGDVVFAQGDYESALVYYTSALQKYDQLGDEIQKEAVQTKLDATMRKMADRDKLAAEAEGYMNQAAEAMAAGDYTGARKYYLLARDVYATIKDEEGLDEVSRKMEMLEIKEGSQTPVQESDE